MSKSLLLSEKEFLVASCIEKYKKANKSIVPDLETKLKKVSDKLITSARKNMFEGEYQNIYSKIPDEWFKKKEYFYVAFEESNIVKQIKHAERVFLVPYPYHGYNQTPTRVIKSDHELIKLADEYGKLRDDLDAAKADYVQDLRKLRREIEASLRPYRTKKQLQEGWPEIFALLPKGECVIKPPAISDLNSRIGL